MAQRRVRWTVEQYRQAVAGAKQLKSDLHWKNNVYIKVLSVGGGAIEVQLTDGACSC